MEKAEQKPRGLRLDEKILSAFALRHKSAMKVLRSFGLLKQKSETRDKRAWGTLAGQERSFRNIAGHCLRVGLVADTILEEFVRRGFVSDAEREKGASAAIMHDATKRQELELITEARAKGKGPVTPKILSQMSRKLFNDKGLQKEAMTFSLARFSGGSAYGTQLDQIDAIDSREKIIEWTVFLADHMVSHTDIVTVKERIEEIIARGEYGEEVDWFFREIYGANAPFPDDHKDRFQLVYAHVQKLADLIESLFKQKLGLKISIFELVKRGLQNRGALSL